MGDHGGPAPALQGHPFSHTQREETGVEGEGVLGRCWSMQCRLLVVLPERKG